MLPSVSLSLTHLGNLHKWNHVVLVPSESPVTQHHALWVQCVLRSGAIYSFLKFNHTPLWRLPFDSSNKLSISLTLKASKCVSLGLVFILKVHISLCCCFAISNLFSGMHINFYARDIHLVYFLEEYVKMLG